MKADMLNFIAVSSYTLYGVRGFVRQKMPIERIGAVSGYNSHKEIDFGAKLALPALLADFRQQKKFERSKWGKWAFFPF